MTRISLKIDGVNVKASQDDTILTAALANHIYIPNLCYSEDLKPGAVCRLCIVDIVGRGLITACNTQVAENMVVITNSPEIEQYRRNNMLLLLANHRGNCLECNASQQCKLQKVANFIGIDDKELSQLSKPKDLLAIDRSNPFFDLDRNKCILCGLCTRTCKELQGLGVIDIVNRGFESQVSTFENKPLLESNCKSCGECVVRCPTGALSIKTMQQPAREVKTVCAYCGVGCGLYLGVRNNKIVSVRGDRDCPTNKGSLCVKGRFGYDFVNSPERLTQPLIKKNGEFVESSWQEALTLVASKLENYKSDKFALLASARATNEDNYVLQKFARVVMNTNNVDHCARLCHAPTVSGLKQTLGSGAMTNTIQELRNAKCIFSIGSNTAESHPVLSLAVKHAAQQGAVFIIANPREIDLCRHATIYLQNRPGTDVALIMGMLRIIIDENLHDKEFIAERSENFEEFKASLANFPIEVVEKITNVPKEKIIAAARAYAINSPAAIIYAMGITQHTHGTDNVIALSNLAVATGNIGKPSSGINPLRGQNNVQGACDMGALPDVFPGYQAVSDPISQQKFSQAWQATLSTKPGLTHLEILDAILADEIQALYIAGENPVISEANAHHVMDALEHLQFLVVQDIFLTETAKYADVVLPAVTFAEKDGTFTNTERRVQLVRKAIPEIGEAKADWQIICELAKKMNAKGFSFKDPSAIMKEIAVLTPIYQGVNYKRLENGGIAWPCWDNKHPGTPILHREKFATASGKAKFIPLVFKPSAELVDNEYPFLLTTDRSIFHYHTATMTRKVPGLNILKSHEVIAIHPSDAKGLDLVDAEEVLIASRRGEVKAKIFITDAMQEGVVSMTFHFAETPTNLLTNSACDPIAKIPETKVCAVKITKV